MRQVLIVLSLVSSLAFGQGKIANPGGGGGIAQLPVLIALGSPVNLWPLGNSQFLGDPALLTQTANPVATITTAVPALNLIGTIENTTTEQVTQAAGAGTASVTQATSNLSAFGNTYVATQFQPITAPAGATQFVADIDRTNIVGTCPLDPKLGVATAATCIAAGIHVYLSFSVSLDGGNTYGGVFNDTTQKPTVQYPLDCGGGADGVPVPINWTGPADATRMCPLPPDQGNGVIVVLTVGGLNPTDIGASVIFN